jgi:hypothetical protein
MFNKRLVILTLIAAPLQASVIYSFAGTGLPSTPVAFQLTLPDYVNPIMDSGFVFKTCSQLDSSTNCQSGLTSPSGAVLFSNQSTSPTVSTATLNFAASNLTEYVFFFATGAFGTPGVYRADQTGGIGNSGTLTVNFTGDSVTTATPEPSSLVEFAAALALVLLRTLAVRRSDPSRYGLAVR